MKMLLHACFAYAEGALFVAFLASVVVYLCRWYLTFVQLYNIFFYLFCVVIYDEQLAPKKCNSATKYFIYCWMKSIR